MRAPHFICATCATQIQSFDGIKAQVTRRTRTIRKKSMRSATHAAILRSLAIDSARLASFSASPAAERDGSQMSAECDRELQGMLERLLAAEEWDAIEITFRIGVREIQRRRRKAVAQSHGCDGQLNAARGIHQMAEHRFVCAHAN